MEYKEYEVTQTRTMSFIITVKIPREEVPEDKEKLGGVLRAAGFDEILKTFRDTGRILVDYHTLDGQYWEEV